MTRSPKPPLTPEQALELLRALHEQIPGFTFVPSDELRKIRRAGYDVDAELASEIINAVGETQFAQEFLHSTPEELRRMQDEAERWQAVERELRVVLRGVTTANAIRRRQIAELIRDAARLSRTLTENEQYSHLVPRVENIVRIRKRKRGK